MKWHGLFVCICNKGDVDVIFAFLGQFLAEHQTSK